MARTPKAGRSDASGTREAGIPAANQERKTESGPEGLRDRLGRFDKASGKGRADPRSLAFSLVIEAAELASLFTESMADPAGKHDVRMVSRIREEIGDVVLGLMRLCSSLGVDPVSAAEMRVLLLDSGRQAESAKGTSRRSSDRPRIQDRRGLLHPPGEIPQEEVEIPDENVVDSPAPPKAEGKRGTRSRSRGRKPPKPPAAEVQPEPEPALVTPPPAAAAQDGKKPSSRRRHRRTKPKPAAAEAVPEPALVTPPPMAAQDGKKPSSRRHHRRGRSSRGHGKPNGSQEPQGGNPTG